jgi:hypothetical protein
MKRCHGKNIKTKEYLIIANEHGFEITWDKGWKKKGWVLQSLRGNNSEICKLTYT